ncbi:MAG: hypothetical protein JJE04_22345 [Acidobacteriia bacterium]|nr:hypothetical protein [Terriglobia bacterium]
MKNVVMVSGLVVAAFLAGYGPMYFKNSELQTKAASLEGDLKHARLRLEVGMMLVEVENGDFGKARERSTLFFNGVQEFMDSSTEEGTRATLKGILAQRDPVTSGLTALDPGVAAALRSIFASMEPVKPQ